MPRFYKSFLMSLNRLICLLSALVFSAFVTIGDAAAQTAQPVLTGFLQSETPSDIVEGADAFGPIRDDVPVAPVLDGDTRLGWVFITSDFVGTTGYSGKPIHTMVAVDDDARVLGIKLVKHSEPIVLIGIPDTKIKSMVADYKGVNLVEEAASGGESHDLNIISGATVTVMVIDDSIIRSGIKVARALGLGGLQQVEDTGPKFAINPEAKAPESWMEMEGDGTVRRLSLDVGQINAAFAEMDDPRAAKRALTEAPETVFIDMQMALVSVPGIGKAILGEAENSNLQDWLEEGEHAIAVTGRGLYSFKGSGYVRGGIFDRIVLIQDDVSVRFRDRGHRRMGSIAAVDAPEFTERDLFKIPADVGFDPTKPFRLQLLVQREVAAIEKVFTTFDLGYPTCCRRCREFNRGAGSGRTLEADLAGQDPADHSCRRHVVCSDAGIFLPDATDALGAGDVLVPHGLSECDTRLPRLDVERPAFGGEPHGAVRRIDDGVQLASVSA